MRLTIFPILLTVLCLVGCVEPRDDKAFLLAMVREHYLWNATVPSDVDLEAHATLPGLLDRLTAPARARGMDRDWTCLIRGVNPQGALATLSEASHGVGQGEGQGEGLGLVLVSKLWPRLHVASVLPGSAAAQAGIGRGDELLAVGQSPEELRLNSNTTMALLTQGGWGNLMGPGLRAGSPTRHLRLLKAGTGARVEVAVTPGRHARDLVVNAALPVVLEAGGGHRVGYVQLRTFHPSAEAQLRQVMGAFRRQGVTDLILDLRYNSGGWLSTMQVVANLLHRDHAPGTRMATLAGNGNQPVGVYQFAREPEAMQPGKLALIMGRSTASASEAVANVLAPFYRERLALVGDRTQGKPVGQILLPLPSAEWTLSLVHCRILNAENRGDYYHGLPDAHWQGPTCAAEDDLSHAPGHPAEACTAAALGWIAGREARNGPIPGSAPPGDGGRPRFVQLY